MPNGGFHDYGSLDVNIGLNGAYSADSILVYWPSGIIQKLWATNANQFITIIEDETTGIEEAANAHQSFSGIVSPNPLSSLGRYEFSLPQSTQVTVAIFDLNGNQLKLLRYEKMGPGVQSVSFNINGLSDGVYLINARGNNYSNTRKIIVLK